MKRGHLHLLGFAGKTAADQVNHFHVPTDFLKLPRWNRSDGRRLADLLKRLSLHLEICRRVDLSGFDIDIAQKVPDHLK